MTKRLNGLNSLSYLGVTALQPPNLVSIDRAPTANDYTNFNLGDLWLDTSGQVVYSLVNKDNQVATWGTFSSSGGASTFYTDSGTATASANAITVAGGTNINTAGSGATVTVNLDDEITLTTVNTTNLTTTNLTTTNLTVDDLTVNNNLDVGGDITADGGTFNDLTVNNSLNLGFTGDGGVLQVDGAGDVQATKGTDGQVLISSTAGLPSWANITSTGGTITISNGANSINIEAGTTSALQFDADSGSAVPSGNIINILGVDGLQTVALGDAVSVGIAAPVSVSLGGTGATNLSSHGVLVGNGTSAVTQLIVGTDGQVLLGATGADPAFATLTSSDSSITFTPGANTLDLKAMINTITYTLTAIDNTDSPYTVLSADQYISVDCSAGVVSVLLPNAPTTGRSYTVKDSTGSAATYNITVTTVGGVVTIDGATTFVMNTAYEAANFIFNGTSWEVY